MSQAELSSRLTLNGTVLDSTGMKLSVEQITIIDSLDKTARPPSLKEELYRKYDGAKQALVRVGGDFPYLRCVDMRRAQCDGFMQGDRLRWERKGGRKGTMGGRSGLQGGKGGSSLRKEEEGQGGGRQKGKALKFVCIPLRVRLNKPCSCSASEEVNLYIEVHMRRVGVMVNKPKLEENQPQKVSMRVEMDDKSQSECDAIEHMIRISQ